MARAVFINNYPTEQAIEACLAGDLPRDHLWGIDHLERLGCAVDVVPFTWSRRLRALTRVTGGRLGELDRQVCAWRLRDGADLVYAASAADLPALAALRASGALRVPLAAYFFHPPSHPAWHALFRGVDLALCLSSRTERLLRERFALPEHRTAVVHWGPDLGFAEFHPPAPLGDVVVSTGKTRRDHVTLLAALREAGLPATVLVHDASPGASARLAGLAGPLTRVVTVPPGSQLRRRDVAAVLRSSRVVAVVAGEEIGVNGLTEVLEAMALGRPVVMTRNRFFDFDVEDIGCGLVVERGDVAGLAAALSGVHSSRELAAALGAAGRRYLEEELNYETFGRELVRALARVAPLPTPAEAPA